MSEKPDAAALLAQGVKLLEERDYEEALRALEFAAAAGAAAPQVHYYTGLCLANLAEYERAITELETALANGVLEPAAVRRAHGALGFLYGQAGEAAEGMHYFERLLALDPGSPLPYEGIGYLATGQKDYARAKQVLTDGLQRFPDNPNLRNSLGCVLLEGFNDLAGARRECERAVELDKSNGAFYDSLAWIRHRQGDRAEAQRLIRRAQQLLPRHPLVAEHAAAILGDEAKPTATALPPEGEPEP